MAVQRDRASLLELLQENVGFLRSSAASFDAGFESEAKRLAVTVRVLVHDTAQSHSLLHQLGVKSQLGFVDTAERINPRNLLPSAPGLVLMQMTFGVGATYIAPLDNIPLSPGRIHPPATFDVWWTEDIARDSNGVLWSRKKFVLTMANKEGGAHVDPQLNSAYESLARHNGFGFTSTATGVDLPFEGNAAAISVRQISHELLKTFEAHATLLL
ncbi:hypothetical protein V2S66_01515 [Streptomyces sp. V4-01]|uniref:Uncharacterized protein n=1 Tax=Actinacidiphila polyblastidii TaxID=3110430 RepID=A0ABU7P4P4_9ACTN|nr:hypothetical protein [Streptomyces sp. V4-01]